MSPGRGERDPSSSPLASAARRVRAAWPDGFDVPCGAAAVSGVAPLPETALSLARHKSRWRLLSLASGPGHVEEQALVEPPGRNFSKISRRPRSDSRPRALLSGSGRLSLPVYNKDTRPLQHRARTRAGFSARTCLFSLRVLPASSATSGDQPVLQARHRLPGPRLGRCHRIPRHARDVFDQSGQAQCLDVARKRLGGRIGMGRGRLLHTGSLLPLAFLVRCSQISPNPPMRMNGQGKHRPQGWR